MRFGSEKIHARSLLPLEQQTWLAQRMPMLAMMTMLAVMTMLAAEIGIILFQQLSVPRYGRQHGAMYV